MRWSMSSASKMVIVSASLTTSRTGTPSMSQTVLSSFAVSISHLTKRLLIGRTTNRFSPTVILHRAGSWKVRRSRLQVIFAGDGAREELAQERPTSELLDCVGDAVAQRAPAAHQSGEVARRNPAQSASRPVLVEAFGFAAQHIAIALAARNDGGVGAHRGREAGDVGHGEELLEACFGRRALRRSAAQGAEVHTP